MSDIIGLPIDPAPSADDYIATARVTGSTVIPLRKKLQDMKVTPTGGTADTLANLLANPTLASLEGLALVTGDVLYASAADTLARLPKGTSGQFLKIGASIPEWAAAPSSDVTSVAGRIGAVTLAQADVAGLLTSSAVAFSSLALGGATIGANALAATGTANISGNTTLGGFVKVGGNTTLDNAGTNGALRVGPAGLGTINLLIGPSGVQVISTGIFGWTVTPGETSVINQLTSGGIATLQLGGVNSATAAVAQTLQAQGSSGASAAAALTTVAGSDQTGTTTTGGGVKIRGGNGTSVGGAVEIWTSATTTPAVAVSFAADKTATFAGAIKNSLNVGTAETGTTAVEYGDSRLHQSVLTVNTTLPAIAGGANLAVGKLLYTFPAGAIVVESAYMSLGITQTQGFINADTPDGGLGTVIGSGVVATLDGTGTFEDILTGQTFNNCTGTAEVKTAIPTAGVPFVIEAGAAHTVYFNVADGWAASGDAAAALAGTVVLNWRFMA